MTQQKFAMLQHALNDACNQFNQRHENMKVWATAKTVCRSTNADGFALHSTHCPTNASNIHNVKSKWYCFN